MTSIRYDFSNTTQKAITAAIAEGKESWPTRQDLIDWLHWAAYEEKSGQVRKNETYQKFLQGELKKSGKTADFYSWVCTLSAIPDSGVIQYFFPDIRPEDPQRRKSAVATTMIAEEKKGNDTENHSEAKGGEAKATNEQATKIALCFRQLLSEEKKAPSKDEVKTAVQPWPTIFWEVFLSDEYTLPGEDESLTNDQRVQLLDKLLKYGDEIVPHLKFFRLEWADEFTERVSEKTTGRWLYWRLLTWDAIEASLLSGTRDKNYIEELFNHYLWKVITTYSSLERIIAQAAELPQLVVFLKQLNANRTDLKKDPIFTPHIERLEAGLETKKRSSEPKASSPSSCASSFWKPVAVAGAGAGLSGAAYYFGYLQLAATLGLSMAAGAAALLFLYLMITAAAYLIDRCGCRQPSSDLAV